MYYLFCRGIKKENRLIGRRVLWVNAIYELIYGNKKKVFCDGCIIGSEATWEGAAIIKAKVNPAPQSKQRPMYRNDQYHSCLFSLRPSKTISINEFIIFGTRQMSRWLIIHHRNKNDSSMKMFINTPISLNANNFGSMIFNKIIRNAPKINYFDSTHEETKRHCVETILCTAFRFWAYI